MRCLSSVFSSTLAGFPFLECVFLSSWCIPLSTTKLSYFGRQNCAGLWSLCGEWHNSTCDWVASCFRIEITYYCSFLNWSFKSRFSRAVVDKMSGSKSQLGVDEQTVSLLKLHKTRAKTEFVEVAQGLLAEDETLRSREEIKLALRQLDQGRKTFFDL